MDDINENKFDINNSLQNNDSEDDKSTSNNYEIDSAISSEDFYDISLADVYKDLNNDPEQTLWPSETYKEFMTTVTQYYLFNAAGDSVLRILKKHYTDQLPEFTENLLII